MAKRKKYNERDLNDEIMMFTSYRDAISIRDNEREFAYAIGADYYKKLSDERLEFTAKDIRSSLCDAMFGEPYNMTYASDYYPYDAKDPVEDFMWALENFGLDSQKKIAEIKGIRVSQSKGNTKVSITMKGSIIDSYPKVSEVDIDNLVAWDTVAKLFDKRNHVIKNNKRYVSIFIKDKKRPWKWDKRDVPVSTLTNMKKVDKDLYRQLLVKHSVMYSVGRMTYVSCVADYVIKNYSQYMSEEEKVELSRLIFRRIENDLKYSGFGFHYSGIVNYDERKALVHLTSYLTSLGLKGEEDELKRINDITAYKDSYRSNEIKFKYNDYANNESCTPYQSHIECYTEWHNLASYLNKEYHYMVTFENEKGKEETIACIESITNEIIPDENNPNWGHIKPWAWKVIYHPIENVATTKSYIIPSAIKSVQMIYKREE